MNFIESFEDGVVLQYKTLNDDYKPTTYSNSGSAIYNATDGSQFATIASPTAFKNLLEATLIQTKGQLINELDGVLPHLSVTKSDKDYIDEDITSIELPHRLGSAWFTSNDEFRENFLDKVREVGVPAAVAFYCPNTLLHGYLFTSIENLNTNISKGLGLISGSIRANNVVRIKNAGVSFDPVLVKKGEKKVSINGEELKGKKLSSSALGHIPIESSFLVTSDDVKVILEIDYDGIECLPVDSRVKELVVNLANYQASKLLNRKINVRVNTILRRVDGVKNEFPEDECLQALIESCEVCKEAGLINPDVVTSFTCKVV